jgi:hypothetical protein
MFLGLACKVNDFNSYDSGVVYAMEEEKDSRKRCGLGCTAGREG